MRVLRALKEVATGIIGGAFLIGLFAVGWWVVGLFFGLAYLGFQFVVG
jgi:hypothetical protein